MNPDTISDVTWSCALPSPEALSALAERLGGLLAVGDALALLGPLGAGKTTFAQGLGRGLQVAPERAVTSPTFALCNEYPGWVPFVHADLYRLEHPAELEALGLDAAFDRAVVAIEWADRFDNVMPREHLTVRFSIEPGSTTRRLHFNAQGSRPRAILAKLRAGFLTSTRHDTP